MLEKENPSVDFSELGVDFKVDQTRLATRDEAKPRKAPRSSRSFKEFLRMNYKSIILATILLPYIGALIYRLFLSESEILNAAEFIQGSIDAGKSPFIFGKCESGARAAVPPGETSWGYSNCFSP